MGSIVAAVSSSFHGRFPFAYASSLGASIIPASFFMCIAFYGMSELSQELENPIGWDLNDIDLNGFHTILTEELNALYKSAFQVRANAIGAAC